MSFIDLLNTHQLSAWQWLAVAMAGFILGFSKSGIKGIGVIIILILAFVFGEKASTGILLPLLVIADVLAVSYYNRHVQWRYVVKLLPFMLVGVLVGVWVGDVISALAFKRIMACIILASIVLMLYLEQRKFTKVPQHKFFSGSIGFLAGFSTMIGNLAGPVSNIYFLAIRLPKNEFIGTGAWLFFIVNVIKLPFHVLVWKTISADTLALNVALVPTIVLGFFLGTRLVKKISNLNYRKFVIIVTAIGGIVLLFR